MIQLDTRNGHDLEVVTKFNELSSTLSDSDILDAILTKWADNQEIKEIINLLTEIK